MPLGERLTAARRCQFAGCAAELASVQAALSAPKLPFQISLVFSPDRVGMTTYSTNLRV